MATKGSTNHAAKAVDMGKPVFSGQAFDERTDEETFSHSEFSRPDFQKASLIGVNFKDADLEDATFDKAHYSPSTVFPEGFSTKDHSLVLCA